MIRQEVMHRITAGTGYGSAGVLAGITLADWDLILRIVVGALSAVSLLIHIFITVRKERKRGKK